MKQTHYFFIILVVLISIAWGQQASAQTAVGIGSTVFTPDVNSVLDIRSTTTGVLLPRMDSDPGVAGNNDDGLIYFNTVSQTYRYYDETANQWKSLGDPGNAFIRNQITTQTPANFNVSGTGVIGTTLGVGTTLSVGNGITVGAVGTPGNILMSIDDSWIGRGSGSGDPKIAFNTASETIAISPVGSAVISVDQDNLSQPALTVNNTGVAAGVGIKLSGGRNQGNEEFGFIDFFNFDSGEGNIAQLAQISVTNYNAVNPNNADNTEGLFQISLQSSDPTPTGVLTERLTLDHLGNLQIDGLIETEASIVTSTTAGVMQSLPIGVGNANKVLKVNGAGNDFEWGDAAISLSNFPNGTTSGDIIYWNGASWAYLPAPTTLPGGGAYYALTIASNNSAPVWSATNTFTVAGDGMGDCIAGSDVDLNSNTLTDADGIVNVDDNLAINGKVVSNGINETSDARFKKNISGISDALSTVLNLKGVTYNWRTEEFPNKSFTDRMEYGVIAQQIEKIVPELVNTDKEGYKSVQYSHMVPLLIEAIKEQQLIINSQSQEIGVLKASVDAISEHIKTAEK